MTRTGQKTAFVFAGGGSLGAIQVGMLRVLVSEGVQPDFVVGASVGAINAAYFAGAPNAEGVEGLAEIWSGLAAQRGLSGHLQERIRFAQPSRERHRFRRPAASYREQLGLRALGGRDDSRSRHRD